MTESMKRFKERHFWRGWCQDHQKTADSGKHLDIQGPNAYSIEERLRDVFQ